MKRGQMAPNEKKGNYEEREQRRVLRKEAIDKIAIVIETS